MWHRTQCYSLHFHCGEVGYIYNHCLYCHLGLSRFLPTAADSKETNNHRRLTATCAVKYLQLRLSSHRAIALVNAGVDYSMLSHSLVRWPHKVTTKWEWLWTANCRGTFNHSAQSMHRKNVNRQTLLYSEYCHFLNLCLSCYHWHELSSKVIHRPQ